MEKMKLFEGSSVKDSEARERIIQNIPAQEIIEAYAQM
jgi:hypothetical protein